MLNIQSSIRVVVAVLLTVTITLWQINLNTAPLYVQDGNQYQWDDFPVLALQQYTMALEEDPTNANASAGIGNIYFATENYIRAAIAWENALDWGVEPRLTYLRRLASAYSELGNAARVSELREEIEALRTSEPSN